MLLEFLIVLAFVFAAVSIMVLSLHFSKYKQRQKKARIVREKKISVSCGACPGAVSKACKGH